MIELTQIEKEFTKIVPDWISQLKAKEKSEEYFDKITDFESCMVGDIRAKLGLSRHYYDRWDMNNINKQYCQECVDYADTFCKDFFEDSFGNDLGPFKEHLEKGHNKKLDNL
jgi:hypothetical protein